MPAGVNLTANLKTIVGGTALVGYLRVTLCGFGPIIPCIPGTAILGDAGVPQEVKASNTGVATVVLWGNDSITPANTFYEIAVLDANKNVIQSGLYQFLNAAGAVDLSSAPQIVGPYGVHLPSLAAQPCTGTVPGTTFTAPGLPIAVFYNGSYLPRGLAFPVLSYTATAETITLNFMTESGDRIDALCIV